MAEMNNRKIVLEDGSVYEGVGFGDSCQRVCEICFNTAVVGYQEIMSDPAVTDMAVVMTYPLIGNYGIADDDFESKNPSLGALIVREYNDFPSNFRYTRTLAEIMEENHIPGISGVDTREITRSIRKFGSRKVLITDIETPHDTCMQILSETQIPRDGVSRASCKKKWYSRTSNPKFNVVAIDCGIKLNTVRVLNKMGCNVTVVPYNTDPSVIEAINPDGILVSSGPGDPRDVPVVTNTIRSLAGRYPMFGIGLGHCLMALACGARVTALPVGHHGGNHPVKNLKTGKIEITAQGHGYVVDENSLSVTGLEITHKNLLDLTVEGLCCEEKKMFSVQYHPESSPGPQDSAYLFDKFVEMMKEEQTNAKKN